MKKCVLFAVLLSVSNLSFSSVNEKKIDVDGVVRTYLEVLPEKYNPENRYPLITFLHPNGMNATDFAEAYEMQSVSDLSNSVLLVPEALDEQDEELNTLLRLAEQNNFSIEGVSLTNVWNAGMSFDASVVKDKLGSYAMFLPLVCPNLASADRVQLNKSVDDVSFLNKMIEEAETKCKIYEDSVFMVGASMGGAMTYRYAYDKSSKVKGIAVICGFVGADVNDSKPLNIPVCIFHSKTDSVVKYDGGFFNKPVETTVAQIVKANGGNPAEPIKTIVNDVAEDGISIETYRYCEDDKRVLFYSIDGATHADFLKSNYVSGPNDMDYYVEVYNFLFGEKKSNSVKEYLSSKTFVAPNPTSDYIISTMAGDYKIYSANGELVGRGSVEKNGRISLSSLYKGVYFININNVNGRFQTKVLKE